MAASPAEWLDDQDDRILSRQRAQADNAKLVATFAAGIAGGLAGLALQLPKKPSGLPLATAIFLALTVLLTGLIILLDRLQEPDHKAVIEEAEDDAEIGHDWDPGYKLYKLRRAASAAANRNQRFLIYIRRWLWPQLALALASGTLAVISMFKTPA